MIISAANPTDSAHIFHWRNDPLSREMSLSSDKILLENHNDWFTKSLENPSREMYIGKIGTRRCGVVRFDFAKDMAEISININPAERGKNLAKQMIGLCCQKFCSDHPEIQEIIAKIKASNTASQRAFGNSAFVVETSGKEMLILKFEPNKLTAHE